MLTFVWNKDHVLDLGMLFYPNSFYSNPKKHFPAFEQKVISSE